MQKDIQVRRAIEEDRQAILSIMEQWNMHHIPSEEMPELDISCFFVATIDEVIVGAAGYKIINEIQGKTTLLGVDRDHNGLGIGGKLQERRMREMYNLGANFVTTNADRLTTIRWYMKHFGYYKMGWIKKVHSFGHENIDVWTTLETDLDEYYDGQTRIHPETSTAPFSAIPSASD